MTKRIQIPSHIIRNPLVSHYAIYLYITLKSITNSPKVIAYSSTILEQAKWTDRRTLKKYLQELKSLELISYTFTDFPINKPLTLDIFPIPKGTQFIQVDTNTIQKIITIGQNVTIETQSKETKQLTQTNTDLKEAAIRLFYLYEYYYNPNYNMAFPSYRTINLETRITNKYIKTLNTLFHENNLVIVNVGEKLTEHKRNSNTYIPICNRKETESDNKNVD